MTLKLLELIIYIITKKKCIGSFLRFNVFICKKTFHHNHVTELSVTELNFFLKMAAAPHMVAIQRADGMHQIKV